MIFKNFNLNIIIRVILIALNSIFIAWFYQSKGINITLLVALALFVLQVINLITFLNRTNRLLTFFFDAVKNEDSTLVFNEKSGSKGFNSLNRSLNLMNQKIQDARIEMTIQEKYYKAVVESATTSIMVFDNKGIVELSNSSMNRMLGISSLHNINQIDRICPKLKDLLHTIDEKEARTLNAQFNGSPRNLLVNAVSMTLKKKEVKLVAIQDISYEIDRQEIDSWQRLIRILNHEIMNSVAPITSLSATLLGFYRKNKIAVSPEDISSKTIANTIKGLAVIEEHGKGLISFVESYRSLTKLPRPKPEEMSISELFDSVSVLASSYIDTYQKKSGKGIDISYQVIPNDLALFADKELIARAVYNMIKNAIEAFDGMDNAAIFLEAGRNSAAKVWIRIIDNGPGIPDEHISNIFVPFFTTKEGGSGIGLSLSKQIISMHKGTLRIFSNPGEGTTVIIQI